jgi:hypothetical protein
MRAVQATPANRAWLLTLPLGVGALLLTAAAQVGVSIPGWQWPVAAVFVVAFIAADLNVLHVEIRRHRFGVSVGEVPMLLALFFLSPVLVVGARALAIVISKSYQRQSGVKVSFNAASQAATHKE